MLVHGFPGITLKELVAPKQPLDALPFPLHYGTPSTSSGSNYSLSEAERNRRATATYYFFARNGIYQGLKYFGIQPGDEILMPELNSTIEPQVVRALGAVPVFYKINTTHYSLFTIHYSDFTPDWDDVRSKLTSRTKFFHLIHYLGVPNDIDRALEFCERNNLIFFEDAAYGFLSRYQGNHNDQHSENKNIFPERSSDQIGTESKDYHTVIPGFSPESKQQTKKQKDPSLPTTNYLLPTALGSFGDFSILCPRKTIPVPNGGILVINKQSTVNSQHPIPPEPPLPPTPLHPFQSSYSSLWDWQYLLRNNASPKFPPEADPPLADKVQSQKDYPLSEVEGLHKRHSNESWNPETTNKKQKGPPLLITNYSLLTLVKRFLKDPYYTFHGSGTFNLKHVNWAMTRLAYHQLFKFDYQTIIQKNLENYKYVRDYCVHHGWDIFPREIPQGCVPNAILLRIRKDQKYNVIPNHQPSSQSLIWDPETKNKKQKDLNGLRVTGYVLREDRPTKDVINNFADWVSQEMLKHGIQLSRPWHWNENISTLKDVPSVDAYTGRGLILPIHYQLTRTHLDYYLSLLSSLLSS